jgi:predicted SnoaL-like aldol condensation-catalyzing enzyme
MELTKEDIQEFYEQFFNQHKIDIADNLIAENYIQHNINVLQGRQALKDAFKKRFSTDEYFRLIIDRILIDQEYIAVFLRNVDKHGRTKFSVIDLYRTEGNQIVEHWDYFDYKK